MLEREKKQSTHFLGLTEVGKLHPLKTMLYFSMAASALLFLVMLGLYTAQRFHGQNALLQIQVPKAFMVSTVVLLFASGLMHRARISFQQDRVKRTISLLLSSGILGLAFAVLQVIGWREFFMLGYGFPTVNVASSYVFVITGIHFLHVLMALGLLAYGILPIWRKSKDPVSELLLVTNPFEKRKLDVVIRFWHYVDALWMVLFVYFVLTF